MVWGLKHNLFRRPDSFSCLYVQILAVISEKFDVDLMKQNVCFWIRLSVEGVGGEAYSHEGMRKKTHVLLYVQGFGGIGQDG